MMDLDWASEVKSPSRVRAWLATVDLARVLAASLFVAVLVLAAALWSTFGPLAGAVGLVVPFAFWYAALSRQRAEADRQARMDAALERNKPPMTRPGPVRAALDEGGELPNAPWTPSAKSYGGA